ncbi:MAG: hypothetical protein PW786_10465 [Arachidicoccus sp.]|nr:hypothetical protein [Arachidicoccus sp.]
MKKISLVFIAIFSFGILFTSCTKDKTITNVVNNSYSDFIDATPQDWQISQDGTSFQITYDASSVPNGFVFNTDGVLIFASGDKITYSPLPLTTATINNFYIDFYLQDNKVIIELLPSDGSSATSANKPTSDFYFNIIFIQPQDLTSSNINTKDYNAVKAAFHIK